MPHDAPDEAFKITRNVVVAAYQAFFRRPPENEAVIDEKIKNYNTIEDFFLTFIKSEEFSLQSENHRSYLEQGYLSRRSRVDVDVTDAQFSKLFDNTSRQWTSLAKTEPFWSVLSDEKFLRKNIENVRTEFYESGQHSANLIDVFCDRNGLICPQGTCLEIGCGVGRITGYLARKFDAVIGVDVSEGNLALCKKYLEDIGIRNVDLKLLRRPEQVSTIGKIDCFFSVIVLQHNPPPIIAYMLRQALGQLQPDGIFLFQVPTSMPGYSFDVEKNLDEFDIQERGFEMHSLPMRYVFDIVAEAGCQMKEVVMDNWAGCYGSHTFFGVKRT